MRKSCLQTIKPQSLPTPHPEPGYAGGNLLNLFCHLQTDLTGYDFSHLTIWQAYLQDTPLKRVNFAHADLSKSVFATTFSNIITVAFSNDGKTLATGHFDGYFILWDVINTQQLIECQAHIGFTWCVGLTQLAFGVGCVRCRKSLNLYKIIGADAAYWLV